MTSSYYLKWHDFFDGKISLLKNQVRELKEKLSKEDYIQHEIVKLAARVRKATLEVIPQDPNRRDYLLSGELKKFRRYKQGLQRYRIIFCFSNKPKIIIYLYLNDVFHLRKQGDKGDPYKEFSKLLKRGMFSHDPNDKKIQKWIKEYKNW